MLWSVQNSIGAEGLPVEDWAAAANALLRDDSTVLSANLAPTYDEDETALDGSQLAGLSVEVLIHAGDADWAAATVEKSVMTALFDVVGDKEVGWTAYDWRAAPARIDPT